MAHVDRLMKLSERAFLLGSLTHQEAAGDGMRFSNSLPLSLCTPSSTNITAWYLLYAPRLLYLHISPFLSHTVDLYIVESSEKGLTCCLCVSADLQLCFVGGKCLVLNMIHVPPPSYRTLMTVFHSLNCDVW